MIKKNLKKQIQIILNLYNSKNLVKAEILNKKLISVYPKLAYLYNLLGLILFRLFFSILSFLLNSCGMTFIPL